MDYELPIRFEKITHYALLRSYNKFKESYPHEEPHIRVTCSRRYKPKLPDDWRSNNKWTERVLDSRNDKIEIKEEVVVTEVVETKKKITTTRMKEDHQGHTTKLRPIIKEVDSREEVTTYIKNDLRDVDVVVDLQDRPYTGVVYIKTKDIYLEYDSKEDIQGLVLESKMMRTEIESKLQTALNDRRDMLLKLSKLETEAKELMDKIGATESKIFSKVKSMFPKNIRNSDDVCTKYIEMQEKLNVLSTAVGTMFKERKCLDMEWDQLKKTHGFTLGLKHAIRWLIDGMNFEDDDNCSDSDY